MNGNNQDTAFVLGYSAYVRHLQHSYFVLCAEAESSLVKRLQLTEQSNLDSTAFRAFQPHMQNARLPVLSLV